jgi:DnaJ family protein C protein 13
VLYLLDIFCNNDTPGLREKTAEVLSKMVMDKLVGPKVRICITKFLPTIFVDAMKQSPEAAISMLDSQVGIFE